METDGDDGGKEDLMSVRDLDSYGVEIGRVVQTSKPLRDDRCAQAGEGDAAWRSLKKGLSTTLAVLKDQSEDVAEDFGLPVRGALHAMRAVHASRAAPRKLEMEEAARLEGLKRIETIVGAATSRLGNAGDVWTNTFSARLDGLTPRQAAESSPELLAKAKRLLHSHVEELAEKAKWVEQLESEASKLFQQPDKLHLYLTTSDRDLPGLAAPNVYTKDEGTMQQCLVLLKRRFGKR
jgi:hypothetical protein